MGLFDTLTGIPSEITQGEAVSWAENLTGYAIGSYSVAYVFNGNTPLDGNQKFTVTGAETGTITYTFTMPTSVKPGLYRWEKQITQTAGSLMRVACSGEMVIKPNLATTQTTTFAASQVALIEANLATLSASTNASVSFNGQSFTRANISDLQRHYATWKARVIAEQAALAALSGEPANRRFVRFA